MNAALIADFKEYGIVVVPSVLTEAEVLEARAGFHQNLRDRGCDVVSLRAMQQDGIEAASNVSIVMPDSSLVEVRKL